MSIITVIGSIGSIATAITALLIFFQLREQKKPFFLIEIKDKDNNKIQHVQEYGTLFIFLTNRSSNPAKHIVVSATLNGKKLFSKNIPYLNPHEMWEEPLPLGDFLKANFEHEHIPLEKNVDEIVPKESIKASMLVSIRYWLIFLPVSVKDEYFLEWYSVRQMSSNNAPRITIANKRKGEYIHKLE